MVGKIARLSETQYQNLRCLDAYDLQLFTKTPTDWGYYQVHKSRNEIEVTDMQRFTAAMRAFLLVSAKVEPVQNDFTMASRVNRQQREQAEAQGTYVVARKQFKTLRRMRNSIGTDKDLRSWIMEAVARDVTFTWDDPITNLPLKVRVDVLPQHKPFVIRLVRLANEVTDVALWRAITNDQAIAYEAELITQALCACKTNPLLNGTTYTGDMLLVGVGSNMACDWIGRWFPVNHPLRKQARTNITHALDTMKQLVKENEATQVLTHDRILTAAMAAYGLNTNYKRIPSAIPHEIIDLPDSLD